MRRSSRCHLLLFGLLLYGGERADAQASNGGAWPFQAPARPSLPAVKAKNWARNPIDLFILAKLEKEKLTPGGQAGSLQLIRRLSFDLTGLPPAPAEIDAFLSDRSPAAYERLVDRLLSSPRHGERWAMFWLDLVRFAESDGFKADDVRPTAWRYRDYVIRSLNRNKPFDRFVREQIAGDELYPEEPEAIVATAFNRHFPDEYNARNLEQRRQEILNDMTDTTAQVFLGLTFGCARCHDHKYDPITQQDYYRLQAFFAAVWPRDDLPMATPRQRAERQAGFAQWQDKTQALRDRIKALEEPLRRQIVSRDKMKYPKPIRDAFDTPPDQRTPLQKQLADMVGKQLRVSREQMAKSMRPAVRKEWQELSQQMARFDALKPVPVSVTMGVTDVGPIAPPTHLLLRGSWQRKGEKLYPGFPEAMDGATSPPFVRSSAATTGRRAALANWLADRRNPLTARVVVNRLWQHHFGRGLVGTPSDFGAMGEQPSHPELLDWLACELIDSGWSLKHLHRLLVTSAVYRQTTEWRSAAAKVDPENRLLWRMSRRRLEGEALRDAMLAVSGELNLSAGGPSVFPELPAEVAVPRGGWRVSEDVRERNRRSVYVFVKRNLRYPFFAAFDAPDSNETCARRHVSTSAPQALMLVNGKFTLAMAKSLAGRVEKMAGTQMSRITQAYRLALGRPPDAAEMELNTAFLIRDGSLVDLCHVLLNLNEFAYVD